jgi:tetratricopeptide (TPR) repeat protein
MVTNWSWRAAMRGKMLGNRWKARGEFRRTVSALAEASLAGKAVAAEAAIVRLGELLPAIRRHHPMLDDAVPLVGYAAGQLLAERETALRAALEVFRSLLTATPFVAELRATLLMVVGESLLRAARRTRGRYLVDEAITLGETAVTTAEPGSQLRGFMLSVLGEAYQLRFRERGDPGDLDRAIDSYRMAADLLGTGAGASPNIPTGDMQALCLDGLGGCLSLKFDQTADLQILEDATAAHRRALQTVPADDLNRPSHLNKLGVVLHRRYRATGSAEALNEAVALSAEAVFTGVPDSTGYAAWLNTHAVFLLERYAFTDDRNDLERSITILRNAARAESSGSASQAMYHSTLGTALITHYHLSTDPTVLTEAVSVHRRAAAIPVDHPARPGRLTRLGDALQETFAHSGDRSTLDEAIDLYREAMRTSPPDDPSRALTMGNLGAALGKRYEAASGALEDVNEAIILLRQSVALLAEDHPNRAAASSNLDRLVELRSQSDR